MLIYGHQGLFYIKLLLKKIFTIVIILLIYAKKLKIFNLMINFKEVNSLKTLFDYV